MDNPVFEWVRGRWPDKATAWDLSRRPAQWRPSADRALDLGSPIVAACEPEIFRLITHDWHGGDDRQRRAAEEITEGQHQLDLEQAARPPVIEVTVTTPPGGIRRLELVELVQATVAEMTDPAGLPVLKPADPVPSRRGRNMLTATRRALSRAPGPPDPPVLPPSEDETPTQELPAVIDLPPADGPPDEGPPDGGELVRVWTP